MVRIKPSLCYALLTILVSASSSCGPGMRDRMFTTTYAGDEATTDEDLAEIADAKPVAGSQAKNRQAIPEPTVHKEQPLDFKQGPAGIAERNSVAVEIYSLTISAKEVPLGGYPFVSAVIRSKETAGNAVSLCAIKASVTCPDGTTKAWWWNDERLSPNQYKEYKLPNGYDNKKSGTYKVEYFVYSTDKNTAYHSLSKTFAIR